MQHEHVFLGQQHARNERWTWLVVALTAAMMVAEISAGMAFGSMALIADGLHMSTHATALAIAALAYLFARRHTHDPRFSFGTGKLGELAGFASAIILAVITILISWESIIRIWNPVSIRFNQAIFVAVVGLGVNLVCAWLLGVHHHAHHEHNNDHHHEHDQSHHTDHNLQSAYMHVLADALTSVLAIVGLLIARSYGWLWIDPVMGIVGAIIIGIWSWRLIRGAGAVLLDTVPDPNLVSSIRRRLERNGDQVGDLHLWRVGPSHAALIASIVSDNPHPPSIYKKRLEGVEGLSHVTVEVQEREILRAANCLDVRRPWHE